MYESHCNAISYNTLCPWKISKKIQDFFTSGSKNRWLALLSPGTLLCPSCFQPSFKVELQRPRTTWRMMRHKPMVCFQAQHWHSLCSSFRKMLLMQGRAEDCLQPPDKDNLAWQPGGLEIKPRGEVGSWGTALIWWVQVVGQLTAVWIRTSMVCTILQHEPRTSNPTSTMIMLGWAFHGNVQVLPEAARRPTQIQQVRMQRLGLVLWKGKAV